MHVGHRKGRAGYAAILFSALLFAAILPAGVVASPALAAAGDLDPSFGGDGTVTTDLGPGDRLSDIAVQPDGRIVAVGSTLVGDDPDLSEFLVARYNPDGSLDTSFGGDGTVTTRFDEFSAATSAGASAVAIQADGKIVVAGAPSASPWPATTPTVPWIPASVVTAG